MLLEKDYMREMLQKIGSSEQNKDTAKLDITILPYTLEIEHQKSELVTQQSVKRKMLNYFSLLQTLGESGMNQSY